jgi:hypothetical protein
MRIAPFPCFKREMLCIACLSVTVLLSMNRPAELGNEDPSLEVPGLGLGTLSSLPFTGCWCRRGGDI